MVTVARLLTFASKESKMRNALLAAVVFALAGADPSSAAILTRTFRLDASNFAGGGPPPVTSIATAFTLTFDTGINTLATPIGSDLGLPSPFGDNLNYAYAANSDSISIGQFVGPNGVGTPSNSFGLFFMGASGNSPLIEVFLVTDSSYQYAPRSFHLTAVDSAVPEPATWAMMLTGLGAVGCSLRLRKPGHVKLRTT